MMGTEVDEEVAVVMVVDVARAEIVLGTAMIVRTCIAALVAITTVEQADPALVLVPLTKIGTTAPSAAAVIGSARIVTMIGLKNTMGAAAETAAGTVPEAPSAARAQRGAEASQLPPS
jgi:hypothetical protein